MSDIPSLTPDKIIKLLEQKGFRLVRTKGSHRIFRNDSTKKMTIVPFHKKDLPKGTMMEILKQAGIKRDELKKLK